MSIKDKLAATLVNHWFLLDQMKDLDIGKKIPKVDKYKNELLADVFKVDDTTLSKTEKGVCSLNKKALLGVLGKMVKNCGFDSCAVEATKTSKTISILLGLAEPNLSTVNDFTAALGAPDQHPDIAAILRERPVISIAIEKEKAKTGTDVEEEKKDVGITPNHIQLKYELKYGQAEFYKDVRELIGTANAMLTGARRFRSLINFIQQHFSGVERADLIGGKVFAVFNKLDWENDKISQATFSLVETPAAKAEREIKLRLDEALRKRTKKVQDLAENAGSITYRFEEAGVEPLTFNVDVITNW